MTESAKTPARLADLLVLVLFVALCLGVAALGGIATATSVDTWYQGLQKPPFNPPNWVFAPVWTTLYVLMGVAACRVWRHSEAGGRRLALTLFAIQLVLNLAWSFLFFGMQRIDLALVDIVLLLLAVAATIALFWPIERLAGWLLVPYFLWVSFATALNTSLWLLN